MNSTLAARHQVVETVSLLDSIVDRTPARPSLPVVRKPVVVNNTFITEPQKKYITDLRNQAKLHSLNALADKKVSNRKAASDYIKELIAAIRAAKAAPKAKGCGCGIKRSR